MDCTVYFTRLTVNEDRRYYPLPSSFLDDFKRDAAEVPAVREIVDEAAATWGVDLLALSGADREPNENPHVARLHQAALFACVAHYVCARARLCVKGIGSYSNGVGPAYLFGEAIGIRDFAARAVPFHRAVWDELGEHEAAHDLSQALIEGDPDDDIEGFVDTAIEMPNLETCVFLKDRRQPHTVLVAGVTKDVHDLLDRVGARFPAVARRRPPVFRLRYAAHLPFLDFAKLRQVLPPDIFGRTRYPIVGIRGQVAGVDATPGQLHRQYHDSVTGAMDTGRALQRLFDHARRVVVIGTLHGARVLAPLRWPTDERIDFAVEASMGLPAAVREGTAYGTPLERYLG